MKYLVIGCIFTFVFALSSAFSNAVFSISTVLCCLMIIYLKLWDKIDITELNIRPVMIAYLIFWISLIIPSVLLGDKYSIIKSFDYFYYSLPLIILEATCIPTSVAAPGSASTPIAIRIGIKAIFTLGSIQL